MFQWGKNKQMLAKKTPHNLVLANREIKMQLPLRPNQCEKDSCPLQRTIPLDIRFTELSYFTKKGKWLHVGLISSLTQLY